MVRAFNDREWCARKYLGWFGCKRPTPAFWNFLALSIFA